MLSVVLIVILSCAKAQGMEEGLNSQDMPIAAFNWKTIPLLHAKNFETFEQFDQHINHAQAYYSNDLKKHLILTKQKNILDQDLQEAKKISEAYHTAKMGHKYGTFWTSGVSVLSNFYLLHSLYHLGTTIKNNTNTKELGYYGGLVFLCATVSTISFSVARITWKQYKGFSICEKALYGAINHATKEAA